MITISSITPVLFNKLYLEHAQTLSCPCSKSITPYKEFLSNTIRFDPVCSSIFVSQEWIKALYYPDASRYGMGDFRTMASSQVSQYLFLIIISYSIDYIRGFIILTLNVVYT
jgi:hypothetical protein